MVAWKKKEFLKYICVRNMGVALNEVLRASTQMVYIYKFIQKKIFSDGKRRDTATSCH